MIVMSRHNSLIKNTCLGYLNGNCIMTSNKLTNCIRVIIMAMFLQSFDHDSSNTTSTQKPVFNNSEADASEFLNNNFCKLNNDGKTS